MNMQHRLGTNEVSGLSIDLTLQSLQVINF